jgi:hypothetical protein
MTRTQQGGDTQRDSILTRYLASVDAGNFDIALGFFAEDATYIRAKLPSSAEPNANELTEMSGRSAIAQFFERRGKRLTNHLVLIEQSCDRHNWLEGLSTADNNQSKFFLCHATFDDSGQISRIIAIAG